MGVVLILPREGSAQGRLGVGVQPWQLPGQGLGWLPNIPDFLAIGVLEGGGVSLPIKQVVYPTIPALWFGSRKFRNSK